MVYYHYKKYSYFTSKLIADNHIYSTKIILYFYYITLFTKLQHYLLKNKALYFSTQRLILRTPRIPPPT